MKKTLLLFTTCFCLFSVFAQNVNIPDPIFKDYLVNNLGLDSNNDSEISIAEAQGFGGALTPTGLGIADLTGIEAFVNITTLDVYNNNLTFLDVSNNTFLNRLHCANNQLVTLDVSAIPSLTQVHCQNNQLIELNLANGNNSNFVYMKSYGNPNLTCIQHDASYSPPFTNAGQYSTGWTRDISSSYSTNCGYDPIYVNASATGANDGSSWNDAYTTIYDALAVASANNKIWVAKGIYTPLAQNAPIEINESVSIYGGFVGTETELTQRDLTKISTDNATIITGDMNGDDVEGDFTTNKNDNADRLIFVDAVNVTLDGFVLQNIYDTSNNTLSEDNGVIYSKFVGASTWIENLTIKNSVYKNNYSNDYLIKGIGLKDNFKLYNVSFKNNKSVGQGIILLQVDRFNEIVANFANVLFADNETKFGIINAYRIPDGSFTNFQNLNLTLTNASFINNNVINANNTSYGQCITMSSDNTRGQLDVNNAIFWGNTLNGVYADRDISVGAYNSYQLNIQNSIVKIINNGGVSVGVQPNLINIQDLDPNTVSLNLDADYKPTSASNYIIDQGSNVKYDVALFGALDLSGNDRIFNSTIDLGSYEYNSTLSANNVSLNIDTIKIYPNPVTDRLFFSLTEQIETLAIYNINGQLVKQANTINNRIDVSELPVGLYVLQIKTAKNTTNKKFLKN